MEAYWNPEDDLEKEHTQRLADISHRSLSPFVCLMNGCFLLFSTHAEASEHHHLCMSKAKGLRRAPQQCSTQHALDEEIKKATQHCMNNRSNNGVLISDTPSDAEES